MSRGNFLFTSESVTEGHPDKLCDQISDAILDAILEKDPYGRVACEVATKTGFVMFLGDNVIQGGISELISEFGSSKWHSQIVLTRVDHPERYGVAELNDDGRILQLIEKPKNPPRIDTGEAGAMLEANDLVLEEIDYKVEGYVDRDSKVGRRVTVEKGAEIINSVVRGPSIIGEDSRIINSYIGPFTSIYHHVTIEDSEIEHSVVLEHSRVTGIGARIQDSLIGRYATIHRSPIKPKAHKLTLGDHSQVGIL